MYNKIHIKILVELINKRATQTITKFKFKSQINLVKIRILINHLQLKNFRKQGFRLYIQYNNSLYLVPNLL